MNSSDDLTPEEARRDHCDMLRFLAINAGFGGLLGFVVAAVLVWIDVGGIGGGLLRSHQPVLAALMLFLPLGLLFAAAVTASAVMLLPYKKKKQR